MVVDYAGQLLGLKSAALAYSDLSVKGDPEEAAEGLFRALRWAEGQPEAERLLIAGVCGLFVFVVVVVVCCCLFITTIRGKVSRLEKMAGPKMGERTARSRATSRHRCVYFSFLMVMFVHF